MTFHIAICDDCAVDSEYILNMADRWAAARGDRIRAERFDSAEAFWFRYAEEKAFDILLLDIEMGEMNGVELAGRVRRDNEKIQIIFITGYPDYMAEGYDVSALHYLMKPVGEEKLLRVLDRAAERLQKSERALLLSVDGEVRRIRRDSVQYVEAFSHSVSVVTSQDTIRVRKSLSEMEEMLGEDFIRCHRCYLVGLRFVRSLSKKEIVLDSGVSLPLSRGASPAVHRAFVDYYMKDQDEKKD